MAYLNPLVDSTAQYVFDFMRKLIRPCVNMDFQSTLIELRIRRGGMLSNRSVDDEWYGGRR